MGIDEEIVNAVTSLDVARAAGVSQSTVSYVMSGNRPISAETRDRVLAAMEQLRYQPHAGARALAGRRTNVIGLVVPFRTAEPSGSMPFIQTIAEVARSRDHDVLLITADEGSAGLKRLAGRALCDGIVLMAVEADDERIPVAASIEVPVVLVGIPDDRAGLYCVDADFAQAARTAVQELARTGHDRVTVAGYPAALTERRINFLPRFIDSAEVAVDRLLSGERGKRHGLIVPEAQLIQPVLHALGARGIVPGHDITVIGHCTDEAAANCEPAVTNLSLEPRGVSQQAMATLFW